MRAHLHLLIVAACAWAVYGTCQDDWLLPLLAGAVLILGLTLRVNSISTRFMFLNSLPLSAIAIIGLVFGFLWRMVSGVPQEAAAPLLSLTSAAQSGAIAAAVLIGLRPATPKNNWALFACAWVTAPLSMDVPLTPNIFLCFGVFSFISIALVIITAMHQPTKPGSSFKYAWDYIIFSVLIVCLTTVLFLFFSRAAVVSETAFFNAMAGYIMPRGYSNFLNISPLLNLINPGVSASDRRPVMEVTLPNADAAYLRMQIFDRYRNGTWMEVSDETNQPMPAQLPLAGPVGRIVMFRPLKKIIPAPQGVNALKGRWPYFRDKEGLISTEKPSSQIIDFTVDKNNPAPVILTADEYRQYTAVPPAMNNALCTIAAGIIGNDYDRISIAKALTDHFHRHFSYSLDVGFSADDKGLLKMLRERKPAYCTYFASAMTLLLRSQKIPARVVTGFLSSEHSGPNSNALMVRVRNAHAWTEALLPHLDPVSGAKVDRWERIDPTPPSFNAHREKKDMGYYLQSFFENLWIGVLRIKTWIENADKDELTLDAIWCLLILLAAINHRHIIAWLKEFLQHRQGRKTYETPKKLHQLHQRYLKTIRARFGEEYRPQDTDTDVLLRLKHKFPSKNFQNAADFINEYQRARFRGGLDAKKLSLLVASVRE